MQYSLKLKSGPSNPTYETVFEPQYKTLFENKPNMIPSIGIRISSEFENMSLDLDNIAEFKISDVPPWTFSQPRILFSLQNDKKSQTDPIVFRTKFRELLSYFQTMRLYLQMVLRMVTQLDRPVLLHLKHINVDYLTMPLFSQRRSKLLI